MVAIGSPFNFDHSVTHGIVSYVGRGFGGADQQYVPFIQTDVPINRGNSGGPLFNMDGQVVGINSQIVSNTGSSVGISLAIPINIAMNVVEQLKQYGHVSRGMIGVQIQNINRAMAQSLGLPSAEGALVASITPGSGADKAGVQVGDVILSFDGHAIEQSSDLPPLVGNTKPGTKADLKVFRDGKTLVMPVTVGELPQDKAQLATTGAGAKAKSANALGIVVDDLTAEQRKQLGIKDAQGVVVIRCARSRRAAHADPARRRHHHGRAQSGQVRRRIQRRGQGRQAGRIGDAADAPRRGDPVCRGDGAERQGISRCAPRTPVPMDVGVRVFRGGRRGFLR